MARLIKDFIFSFVFYSVILSGFFLFVVLFISWLLWIPPSWVYDYISLFTFLRVILALALIATLSFMTSDNYSKTLQ